MQFVMLKPKQPKHCGNPKSHTMVLIKQTFEVMQLHQTCSYQYFSSLAMHNPRSAMVVGPDLQVLQRLEAVALKCQQVKAITCTHALATMKRLKVPAIKLAAMQAMKLNSISMDKFPIPVHVMCPSPMLEPCPQQLQVRLPLPRTLPDYELPANLRWSYGLLATQPDLFNSQPLSAQLSQLRAWCLRAIETTRMGPPLNLSSFQLHVSHMSCFLGHCFHHQHVARPSLLDYLDLDKMCNYLNMHVAQQHSPKTVDTLLGTAQLVIKWWISMEGDGAHHSLAKALQWLKTMNIQVSSVECLCNEWHVGLGPNQHWNWPEC